MRRFRYWILPLAGAVVAALLFGLGFYSFLSGDTGTAVTVTTPPRAESAAPRTTIVPLVLGDSLARGTGDESGLGIGGRLVDELRRRHVPVANAVNVAVNGSRAADLDRQLASPNVRTLIGQSNVVIVSIGGNDLWGDNFRNATPRDPGALMDQVLERVVAIEHTIRAANATARIFIIGLYNPFVSTPMGRLLTPYINRWNALMVERFAGDPNVVVVQTSDLFAYHDRLSFDRFHPANEGYELIARRIADAI